MDSKLVDSAMWVSLILMGWIVIFLMDSTIQGLNNWPQQSIVMTDLCEIYSEASLGSLP